MIPPPPVDHSLDTTGQTLLTVVTSVVAIGFVLLTIHMCRQRNSTVPALITLSGFITLVLEPIYDNQFHIWFYDRGEIWGFYSAYGMEQPIWVPITYVWCYGGLALLVWRQLEAGITRGRLVRLTAMLCAIFTAFEMIGISLGVYTYYGDHPFRVFDLPLWVEVSNTSLTVVAGIAFFRLEPLLRGWSRISLLAIVPACFAMFSFGSTYPTLVVISRTDPSTPLMYGAAIVSMALAVAMLHLALQAVPKTAPVEPESGKQAVLAP